MTTVDSTAPVVRVSTVPWAARLAAGWSLLAGAIHLVVTPEHLDEWWLYGVFFLVVALSQLVLAGLLVRRPGTRTLLAGVWGNVAVIGTYVASRTVGLPIGPAEAHGHEDGQVLEHQPVVGGVGNGMPVLPGTEPATTTHLEGVGALDLGALGAQLALVVLLVTLLPARHQRATLNAFLVLGALAWGVRVATSVLR